MIKTLKLALFVTVSFNALAYADSLSTDDKTISNTNNTLSSYTLDEETITNYQLKENDENITIPDATQPSPTPKELENAPKILKEEIKDGYIEKLVNNDGLVIAEKKVIKGNIVERVLNEYHPNKKIARKIISTSDDGSFYAEEYYTNGKISSEATYINDANKLGVEKKYDTNGVLRQEIPWEIVKTNSEDEVPQTKRMGYVKTYYPDGKIAAVFSVGKKGNNVFYNKKGKVIKKIQDKEILSFSKELKKEDCDNLVVELNTEEIITLYEDEGDISYNKCGLPYKEMFVYEVITSNDRAGTKLSFDETGMLRRTTPYSNGFKNGIERKYDASGNLTAEIPYSKGTKEGFANGYFPTREIAFRKRYENDKVVGNLTCYFPTGEVAAEIPYKDGLKDGIITIQSPVKKEIEYSKGELVEKLPVQPRQTSSILKDLKDKDSKCLNLKNKYQTLVEDIDQNIIDIKNNLTIQYPKNCADMNKFKRERSRYVCYENNIVRGAFPPTYNKRLFAKLEYYNDASRKTIDVPHNETLPQGFARKYDEMQNIITELNYDKGELISSNRAYYQSGIVKNLFVVSEDKKDHILNTYNEDGGLIFSLNYTNGKKQQAYLTKEEQNKNIYVKYHEGKVDNIREVNRENPLNYIEYNLSSNEYGVYKNGNLIKGGDICIDKTSNIEELDFNPNNFKAIDKKDNIETANKKDIAIKEEIKKLDEEIEKIIEKEDKAHKSVSKNNQQLDLVETPIKDVNVDIIPPIIKQEDAPIVEGLEEIDTLVEEIKTNTTKNITKDNIEDNAIPQEIKIKEDTKESLKQETYTEPKNYKVENAIIPTIEEKEAQRLAAQNIGPIAKPDIDNLADVVSKQTVEIENNTNKDEEVSNTEKFYYPNGSLRKTIRTKGKRTEEIKEYSKNGLLLTDTIYNDNGILIEKYYGSGEVRRKTNKGYSDNAITSFISRIDFYNTGKPRYEINRKEDTLLFNDKEYNSNGKLIKETNQTSPLSYIITEYDDNGKTIKQTTIIGKNVLTKEFKDGVLDTLTLNEKNMPKTLEAKSDTLLKDNAKTFGTGGAIVSEFKYDDTSNILYEYYPSSKVKTEIIFYNNGEISIKSYTKDSELEKFAYLSTDGKLYIQKPEVRTIPSYRERYWVDYNNPNWIENTDKYSVKSIARLTLDTTAYMLNELEIEIPDILRRIYELY